MHKDPVMNEEKVFVSNDELFEDSEDFEDSSKIDATLFGLLAKKERMNLGYRKAEDFATVIGVETGYIITRDSIYRIERGEKEPPIGYLIALNIMRGKPANDFSLLELCIPKKWKDRAAEEKKRPRSEFKFVFDPLPF